MSRPMSQIMLCFGRAIEGSPMTLSLTVLFAACLASAPAAGSDLNRLQELKVIPTERGAQVTVRGNQSPNFTVFRLPDPDRLIVDVSSTDAHAIEGQRPGAGPISGVVTSQFSDARSSVGRILVGLARPSRYDVHAEGDQLLISVFEEDKEAASADRPGRSSAEATGATQKPAAQLAEGE